MILVLRPSILESLCFVGASSRATDFPCEVLVGVAGSGDTKVVDAGFDLWISASVDL